MADGSRLSVTELRAGRRRKAERPAELWTRVNRILATVVCGTAICALVLWLLPEVQKRDALARGLDAKKLQLAEAQQLQREHERERFLLENDAEYIETIARDRLDLMKEGETIFRLEPTTRAPSAADPPAKETPPTH